MSRPPARRVLLLREPDAAYTEALARAGFEPAFEPVLRFSFPTGWEDAMDASSSALVMTSPRAVEAVARAALRLDGRRVFVVGPTTADAVRALGGEPVGEESGVADALADLIEAGAPFPAPLLFLCGNRRRDTLPDRLRAASIAFTERVVYHTELVPPTRLATASLPDAVVFFSPSGVEAAALAPAFPWSARRVAIGPTTASALRDLGHPADAVAAHPTPDSLVSALASALTDA